MHDSYVFNTPQATWEGLREAVSPLDVGILVNNVGLSYDHAEYFDAIDDSLIDDLVQVNIQATNKVGSFPAQTPYG